MTAEKLRARGINRLVDVRAIDERVLRQAVGSMADWLRQLANGIDDRPVVAHRRTEIVGFGEHVSGRSDRHRHDPASEIAEMARHAVEWLERRALLARTVTIKVRYSDFTTVTRSHTAVASRDAGDLSARALQLLEKTRAGQRPVRLLGVSVHNLCTAIDQQTESADWLPFVD